MREHDVWKYTGKGKQHLGVNPWISSCELRIAVQYTLLILDTFSVTNVLPSKVCQLQCAEHVKCLCSSDGLLAAYVYALQASQFLDPPHTSKQPHVTSGLS